MSDHLERLQTALATPARYITGRVVVVPADLRAALNELEQLRAQVADFPEQLADAQEMALDKLVEAFGEGWDNCRMHLEDEGRLKRGVAVTQYSNTLPWPTYASQQQCETGSEGL